MSTIRDLVTLALQKHRVIALGESPTAAEADAGLQAFQHVVDQVCQGWIDVDVSAAYTAGEDERIRITSGSPTITYPTTVVDAVTGCQRAPRSGAKVAVISSAGVRTMHLYQADKGQWVEVSGLTLNSDCPFDAGLEDLATEAMGVRLAKQFADIDPREGLRALSLLSLAVRPTDRAVYS